MPSIVYFLNKIDVVGDEDFPELVEIELRGMPTFFSYPHYFDYAPL